MDSSFDDDELIKDLGDLGLAFAESRDKPSKESSQKEKKPKKTEKEKNPPKRRPPSKVQINLDDLMDGVTSKAPAFSLSTNTSNSSLKIPEKNMSLEGVESRLNSYLAMQIRTLINEFSVEIDKMFQENDEIEPIINGFLTDIRQSLRESCNFDISGNNFPSANSLFDSFSFGFGEAFKSARMLETYKPQENVQKVKTMKSKFVTFPSVLRQTFNNAMSDMSAVSSDRDVFSIRQPVFDNNQAINEKFQQLSLTRYELECKAQMQEEEARLIQERMRKLDEQRAAFSEALDKSEIDDSNDVNDKIRRKISKINSMIKKVSRPQLIADQAAVKSMLDEITSMRQSRDYCLQQMCSFVDESKSIVPGDARVNYAPQNESVVASNIAVADDDSTSTSSLLNKVRRKLSEVQAQRDAELQNATTFLNSMKRRERKRRRRNYPSDSDSQI